MDKYNLQSNEMVILLNEEVEHGGKSGELVLTNLNLIHIVSKGVFKTTYVIQRYSIRDIRLVNVKAQAILGKDGDLDIYFMTGTRKSFEFYNKRESAFWLESINKILVGEQVEITKSRVIPGTYYIARTLKGTIDTFKGVFKEKIEEQIVAGNCGSCGATVSGKKGDVTRCQYCDCDQQL